MKKDISQKTSWGGVAEWYDELLEESSDSFQAKVILPNLLRILNIQPKSPQTKIIDIACGQGHFSRALEQVGAKVTGADISPELIKTAKERSSKTITFHVASADRLTFAQDASFDVALLILSLQNIGNLPLALFECSRVLKTKGRLVIVLNHPTFRIPQKSSWDWDEKRGKQYRRIDAYLKEYKMEIDMTPGEKDKAKKKHTVSFHRPLQSYFKFLHQAGFAVTALEEWTSHKKSQKGPRSAEEDRIRKEIPMFLMLEAVKLS
ncbi:MAG: class I SAM-dependent methyltransferase [Patescibacteria group bacterium]